MIPGMINAGLFSGGGEAVTMPVMLISAATSLSRGLPPRANGDIIVASVLNGGTSSTKITIPSGWNVINHPNAFFGSSNNRFNMDMSMFWRRVDGSESLAANAYQLASVGVFRFAANSGSPVEASDYGTIASEIHDVATLGQDRMVILAAGIYAGQTRSDIGGSPSDPPQFTAPDLIDGRDIYSSRVFTSGRTEEDNDGNPEYTVDYFHAMTVHAGVMPEAGNLANVAVSAAIIEAGAIKPDGAVRIRDVPNFRYIRWFPAVESRSLMTTPKFEVAEFQVTLGGATVPWNANASANTVGYITAFGSSANNLLDGSSSSRWMANGANLSSSVIIDNKVPIRFDGYRFMTTNQSNTYWDPVSWVLEGSDDAATWYHIDAQISVRTLVPTDRSTYTDIFEVSSYRPVS